jgi:hypothetical protein
MRLEEMLEKPSSEDVDAEQAQSAFSGLDADGDGKLDLRRALSLQDCPCAADLRDRPGKGHGPGAAGASRLRRP